MTTERIVPKTNKSFFLFGPRASGKSTWLKKQLSPDYIFDLLISKEYLKLSTQPEFLRELIEGNPKFKLIVIDEIQKLPKLLDEVHALIFDYENKIQFILTGSSARKLKKKNVNLLAGRALVRYFHPFVAAELKKNFHLSKALQYGMLPQVWNLKDGSEIVDYLYSYVDTYLKEEIQQEAAVRQLPSYISFLEHFALRNGQVINIQSLAGEIGVPRTTLNGYLEILEQTLMGIKLKPIELQAKVKEVSLPKFYFFDTGVCRTLSKQIEEVPTDDEKGSLLETYLLHELKAYNDYFLKRWEFYYWGTPSQNEVDFVICKGKNRIGIEVKHSKNWKTSFNKGLEVLLESKKIAKAYGVYTGKEILVSKHVQVYPIDKFIEKIYAGEISPR